MNRKVIFDIGPLLKPLMQFPNMKNSSIFMQLVYIYIADKYYT